MALEKESAEQTKAARLREIFGEIETVKRAGVSNARIVEKLNTQGFNLTIKTFETMLHRIRKKQRKTTAIQGEPNNDQGKQSAKSNKEVTKIGRFEVPKPKRFILNPTPEEDLF